MKNMQLIQTNDPRALSFSASENGNINSVTINEILKLYPNDKYNLLIKMILKGEKSFEKNVEWIEKFKIIIIEPQDWMYPNKHLFRIFEKISLLDRDFIILNENIVSIRKINLMILKQIIKQTLPPFLELF